MDKNEQMSIFDIFQKEAKEFKVEALAKALMDAVEGIGYPPKRLRVFTSEAAYKRNVASIKEQKDVRVLIDRENRFNVRYGGIPYFYTFTTKVDVKPDDTYNSIFLGVDYTNKSFNSYSPLKHATENGIEYYVYTHPKAPKCLRVGIIGTWSDDDLTMFDPYSTSAHFEDPKVADTSDTIDETGGI